MNSRVSATAAVVRGPVMLIALGILVAIDYAGSTSFSRTWPVLLILFGAFALLEHAGNKHP